MYLRVAVRWPTWLCVAAWILIVLGSRRSPVPPALERTAAAIRRVLGPTPDGDRRRSRHRRHRRRPGIWRVRRRGRRPVRLCEPVAAVGARQPGPVPDAARAAVAVAQRGVVVLSTRLQAVDRERRDHADLRARSAAADGEPGAAVRDARPRSSSFLCSAGWRYGRRTRLGARVSRSHGCALLSALSPPAVPSSCFS